MKKATVRTFKEAKETGEKLTMITCYDYSTAKLVDKSGIDSILIGDSLGMTMLGYEDTLSVTLEDMIHHLPPWREAQNIPDYLRHALFDLFHGHPRQRHERRPPDLRRPRPRREARGGTEVKMSLRPSSMRRFPSAPTSASRPNR